MSATEICLARHLVEELFGETVENVCCHLLENGPSPLRVIAAKTNSPQLQVKKSLCVLINHHIVTFERNKKGFVEYQADIRSCLLLARYPRYIYSSKTVFGDAGELIVEELLHGGKMVMSVVVDKVTERLKKAVEGSQKVQPSLVKGKFVDLVNTQFLQRVPVIPDPKEETVSTVEDSSLLKDRALLFRLPNNVEDIGTPRGKRKRPRTDVEPGPSVKRAKMESGESAEYYIDEDIYWQVNIDRFHQHFRDQDIIIAVSRSNSKLSSEIVRTILRISELTTDIEADSTAPISFHDILRGLPTNLNIDRNSLEQYLKILNDNQTKIVTKVSETGGGMYIVDLQKAAVAICSSCIESVVQERFGSKSHRIFRLVMLKKYLEQKQIETFALIPAKEAKELLYQMFAEGFITVQELSKAPDHAPSRTYYPFFINLKQVCQMVRERCCKSLVNLISRRKYERNDNKRLLEKSQRVEVIAASFRSGGADPSHIAEIEEMITPSEKEQLKRFKTRESKLETSELQLEEMMFTLENFLIHQFHSFTPEPKKPNWIDAK